VEIRKSPRAAWLSLRGALITPTARCIMRRDPCHFGSHTACDVCIARYNERSSLFFFPLPDSTFPSTSRSSLELILFARRSLLEEASVIVATKRFLSQNGLHDRPWSPRHRKL